MAGFRERRFSVTVCIGAVSLPFEKSPDDGGKRRGTLLAALMGLWAGVLVEPFPRSRREIYGFLPFEARKDSGNGAETSRENLRAKGAFDYMPRGKQKTKEQQIEELRQQLAAMETDVGNRQDIIDEAETSAAAIAEKAAEAGQAWAELKKEFDARNEAHKKIIDGFNDQMGDLRGSLKERLGIVVAQCPQNLRVRFKTNGEPVPFGAMQPPAGTVPVSPANVQGIAR